MNRQMEALRPVVNSQEEDAPEGQMDHLVAANGHNAEDDVFDDSKVYLSKNEHAETAEESDGHTDSQGQDEASRLRSLATDVRDQDDLERDIGRQVGRETSLAPSS